MVRVVYNPPGTNDPDVVSSATGSVCQARTPDASTHDEARVSAVRNVTFGGNLLSDGRFTYACRKPRWAAVPPSRGDAENRLTKVETRDDLPATVPRVRLTYSYDYQWRRLETVREQWDGQDWEPVSTNRFVYDGWNLIADLSDRSAVGLSDCYYVWGLDLSGTIQGAGGVGGLLAEVSDGTPYVAAFDANGNVTEYLASDGAIAAHYEYSPFGAIVVQSGELADSFLHRFSNKPWCPVTGLSEYLYRKYGPGMGRWLSCDPIGERPSPNLVSFGMGNPVLFVDTDGRELFPKWARPGTIWGCEFDSPAEIPAEMWDDAKDGASLAAKCACATADFAWETGCTAADFAWKTGCTAANWVWQLPTEAATCPYLLTSSLCGAEKWKLSFCCDDGEKHEVTVYVGGLMSDYWGMTPSSKAVCLGTGTLKPYPDLPSAMADAQFRAFLGHECGHAIEAELLGPAYLPCVVPFTGWSYGLPPFDWAEAWADRLGTCISFPEAPKPMGGAK